MKSVTMDEVYAMFLHLKLHMFVDAISSNMIDGATLFHCNSIECLTELGINKRAKAGVLLEFIEAHRINGIPPTFLTFAKGILN